MTAIELLAQHLPPLDPPEPASDGVCCLLGMREPCIARKHAIKPSFTNLDFLRAPDSDCVSVRAWRVMTEPAQRQSSWICDAQGFRKIDRLGVRRLVIDEPPTAPWSGYATTSYKKHGALRAPLNHGDSRRWLFELDIVDCSDSAKVADWWERLRSTRVAGIPRPVIETLDCSVHLMSKHAALWREFEAWARPKVNAPLFRFLVYLLPSEEEIRGKQN